MTEQLSDTFVTKLAELAITDGLYIFNSYSAALNRSETVGEFGLPMILKLRLEADFR